MDWSPLLGRAKQAAAAIRKADHVTVIHHIDADGMSAAAVACCALEAIGFSRGQEEAVQGADERSVADAMPSKGEAGRPTYTTIACRSLDDAHKNLIQSEGKGILWFCDFGSTTYMEFSQDMIVCDHHELVRNGNEESFPHVNPLLDDLPGDGISGSGCTYLVARELGQEQLLPLALVGAAGDIQDREGFHGYNQELLQQGEEMGLLEVTQDLRFFGPETRPLGKFLSLHQQPSVPGLNRPRDVEEFLQPLGIDNPNQMWSELSDSQQVVVRSAIVNRLLDTGTTPETIEQLMGPVIRITAESPQTPTREIKEFATLLNSTARYDEADIGLKVAMGDRGDAYNEALDLRNHHKRYLMKSLNKFQEIGIQQDAECCWIDVGDQVRDTVLGIVCGMALNALPQDRPLIAFARNSDGVKISSRAPKNIQGRIDLASIMRECSAAVDPSGKSVGGGHKGAAGASIPAAKVEEFLELVKLALQSQGFGKSASTETPDRWSGQGQTRLC